MLTYLMKDVQLGKMKFWHCSSLGSVLSLPCCVSQCSDNWSWCCWVISVPCAWRLLLRIFLFNSFPFLITVQGSSQHPFHLSAVMCSISRCWRRLWTCSWRPTWFSRARHSYWTHWRTTVRPRDRYRPDCWRWTSCTLHRWVRHCTGVLVS